MSNKKIFWLIFNIFLVPWTISSWVKWASFPRLFIFLGRSLWNHLSSFSRFSGLEFLASALALRASWYLPRTNSNCLWVPFRKKSLLLSDISVNSFLFDTQNTTDKDVNQSQYYNDFTFSEVNNHNIRTLSDCKM